MPGDPVRDASPLVGSTMAVELFAKFAGGQVILPANLRFYLFDFGCDLVKNAV